MPAEAWQPPLRLLFVCEGNVCRSPTAELLLGAAVPSAVVRTSSAGVNARVGDQVAEDTARLLRAAGVDPTGFVARQLDDALLAAADLIVVMTAAQRSSVVRRSPAAMRRAWTLLDLVGTLQQAGLSLVDDPEALLAARTGGFADVPDPWGRGSGAHRRTFGMVKEAVDRLAASVT